MGHGVRVWLDNWLCRTCCYCLAGSQSHESIQKINHTGFTLFYLLQIDAAQVITPRKTQT